MGLRNSYNAKYIFCDLVFKGCTILLVFKEYRFHGKLDKLYYFLIADGALSSPKNIHTDIIYILLLISK